ncbi:Adenine phosphoribosyltransferase 5 [Salvia divinorum]|uniref:adenine phosphoribosyltransferase n=1 Tax=Salvia divinorum TaxID=28513 RepID=A0ABD1H7F2_SALDI
MFAAENGLKGDPRLKAISDAITVVPHFPKPGIMFQDITTLVSNHKVFKHTVEIFVDRYRDMDISVVAGVEARGFMFAPSIALGIGAKFIPLRKPGKLPGEVISEAYELEYGKDRLEMHVGAVKPGERALVIDDLVATGGTLSAAIRLLGELPNLCLRLHIVYDLLLQTYCGYCDSGWLERNGAEVVECACVIGLPELKERRLLNGKPLYVLVEPREL